MSSDVIRMVLLSFTVSVALNNPVTGETLILKPRDSLRLSVLESRGRELMNRKKIVCIFCGNIADIVRQGKVRRVICSACNKETDLDHYQKIFDQWVDEIRKDD
jgi:hypothetical protein